MKSQLEKNKEILLEEIEKYSCEPINNATADRLNAYRGAYKALCLMDGHEYQEKEKSARDEPVSSGMVEIIGDTELEKLLSSIPLDEKHVKAIVSIFANHMQGLEVVNRRTYDNIMERIREVAAK